MARPHMTIDCWPKNCISNSKWPGLGQWLTASLFLATASNAGPEKNKYSPHTNHTECPAPLVSPCQQSPLRADLKSSVFSTMNCYRVSTRFCPLYPSIINSNHFYFQKCPIWRINYMGTLYLGKLFIREKNLQTNWY